MEEEEEEVEEKEEEDENYKIKFNLLLSAITLVQLTSCFAVMMLKLAGELRVGIGCCL